MHRHTCGCQRARCAEQTYLEVLRDFPDEPLERQLPDEELCRFLVPPDLAQCDSAGAKPVGLLYASRRGLLAKP